MNKKRAKEIRTGIRLNMRKAPKVEIPKNVYNRKRNKKHGLQEYCKMLQ